MSTIANSRKNFTVPCIALLILSTATAIRGAELFVADRATDRILSFDETTGEFLRVVTDTGLSVPSGLTFGPGGFLYVSNLQSGFPGSAASVVKVDPVTGTTTPFVTDVAGAGGVAYNSASNTLFVAEFGNFDGDEVTRYDAAGTLMQTLGTGTAATGRAGMTFDAGGNLYVSESNFSGVGSVLKYEAPAGDPGDDYASTATTFASGADATLQFPAPAGGFNGLRFDSSGDLLVASLIGQSVIKYDVSGGVVTGGASYGPPLPYPSSVLIGADGNLIVTNLGNDNPSDPFWGPNVFPGELSRYNGVSSVPLLGGDSNRDDVVDGADLALFQASYGVDDGSDLDGDLDTDGQDFLFWQRGFGNQGIVGSFQPTAIVRYIPSADSVAIPEPAGLCLLSLGFACIAICIRS